MTVQVGGGHEVGNVLRRGASPDGETGDLGDGSAVQLLAGVRIRSRPGDELLVGSLIAHRRLTGGIHHMVFTAASPASRLWPGLEPGVGQDHDPHGSGARPARAARPAKRSLALARPAATVEASRAVLMRRPVA